MRLVAFARFAVVSLVLTAVACRGTTSPVNPSPGVAGGGGQPPPASVTVSRLQIGGPDSVPPGEAIQLSATAFLSDGTTRIVTNEVSWESFHGHMMSISSTGVVTAGPQPGEGLIIAKYSGLPLERQGAGWASREQLVLPAGTYRLYGSVKDEGVTLNGVRVELTAGPAAGMSLIANGYFRFYGVSGDTEIRVSKDGYETQVRRSQVTSNRTEEFALALSSPRPVVDGRYTLTIAAAAECRAALPEAARERTYRAAVTQTGAALRVRLEDPSVQKDRPFGPADVFGGSLEPGRALFWLHSYYGDYPDMYYAPSIIEELPGSIYLTFGGAVVAHATSTGYSGTLNGGFEVVRFASPWDYRLDQVERVAYCGSERHQFVLSR